MHEEEFSDFIVDAATLRLHQIRKDRLRKSFDGTTIYAVDANVVVLFANPAAGQRGRIFRRDADAHATAMSYALAEYIFFELTPLPIFQFLPHAREVGAMFDVVSRSAISKDERFIKDFERLLSEFQSDEVAHLSELHEDQLSEYRSILLSKGTSVSSKDEYFQSKLQEIVSIIFPSVKDPTSRSLFDDQKEYRQFLKLYASNKIIDQTDAAQVFMHVEGFEQVGEIISHDGGIRDWVRVSERKQHWLEEFSKYETGRRPANLENDADALASLEALNAKLTNVDARVVLLTSDPVILGAVRNVEKTEGRTTAHVLHPVSMVFEAMSWHDDNDRGDSVEREFSNWLDALLTTYTGGKWRFIEQLERLGEGDRDSIASLRESIRLLSEVSGTSVRETYETWEEFKKPLLALELVYEETSDDLLLSLIEETSTNTEVSRIESQLAALRNATLGQLDKKWDEILIAFVNAGLGILLAFRLGTPSDQRPRNPPLVRFDGFPYATKLVRSLSATHDIFENRSIIESQLQSLAKDTKSKVLGNTDLGYVSCLVWGALCASEGKWAVTRGLAGRAVRIAETDLVESKNGVTISGREAYYLLSVSQRLTISVDERDVAQSIVKARADLEMCEQNLGKAINALKSEPAGSQNGKSKKTVRGIRFDVERYAVEITRANLDYWFGVASDRTEDSYTELLRSNVDKLVELNSLPRSRKGSDQEHSVQVMKVNLCVNALQAAHICIRTGIGSSANGVLKEAKVCETLISILENDAVFGDWDFHRTLLIDAHLCLAKRLTEMSAASIRKSCSSTFRQLKDRKLHVMPYDVRRFADLEELVLHDELSWLKG